METRQGPGRDCGRWWGGLGGCVCGGPRGFLGDDHTARSHDRDPRSCTQHNDTHGAMLEQEFSHFVATDRARDTA
jgi:hypothetical protein